MRLNKYIAQSGVCSRRHADELIGEGRVKVNGEVVRTPGIQVVPGDQVSVDHQPLRASELVYVIMNKPAGVTSTVEDPFAQKKIVDMVPSRLGRLYPVGRLDKDSRGLIILTNDGDLCQKLTHPRFEIEKEYVVLADGRVPQSACLRFKRGIKDQGELLKVTSVRIQGYRGDQTVLQVIVKEGKKRHLRRLFAYVGYPVRDLKRVRIGNIRLGNLAEGEFKIVDKKIIYGLIR
ncbi:MAG: rRNA pseudouridine synthase [Candidatus Omnitrophica bacterium]|nr:rRNA pseudouridine synthase [Candidatus Omnitrophota bacterium]